MPDLERKKVLKESFKAKEQEMLVSSMELSVSDLKALFVHLDSELKAGCDHTLSKTLDFLGDRKFEPATVIPWLKEHGGYCDCEVLVNVESDYECILRS
ncbi:DUF2695 domain-containing protein [Methylophilus sp. UBA6697]|jgi:hypothetical protein|uniref:DUF2695 domain-containing protein n=2 Tax=unclassified Methylophilus TaxID=2630143 RepID=UPI000645CAF1